MGANDLKDSKSELSSKVKTMKFMVRKQEAEIRKQLEQQQRKVIDEQHWVLDSRALVTHVEVSQAQVRVEPSLALLKGKDDPHLPRRTFQNFGCSTKDVEVCVLPLNDSQADRSYSLSQTPRVRRKKHQSTRHYTSALYSPFYLPFRRKAQSPTRRKDQHSKRPFGRSKYQ